MLLPGAANSWKVTPKEAIAIQRRLAGRVTMSALPRMPRLVVGLDCAFSKTEERCYAAAVVWDLTQGLLVETKTAERPLDFPYVPGLLSFREIPALLDVLSLVESSPHLLMCDGQGYAHPRRFGLACHLGVITGIATCGCAKSRLVGIHEEPGSARGSRVPLTADGQVIGEVVRTRDGVKPLYVSVGHLIDLPGAVACVLAAGGGYRLPEPTRLADRLVGEFKRSRQGPS